MIWAIKRIALQFLLLLFVVAGGDLLFFFYCYFSYIQVLLEGCFNPLPSQHSILGHHRPANWPRGYKTFFMLNSAEHEIYPADKC